MWYYYQKNKKKANINVVLLTKKIKKPRRNVEKMIGTTNPPAWLVGPTGHGLAVTERERQAYEREGEPGWR
jgi:hypothetical protein